MEKWRKHLEKVNEELSMFGITLGVEYDQDDNCYYFFRVGSDSATFCEDNISEEELCEEINVAATNLIKETINKPGDVSRFFKWLVECKQLCFHPDDSFFDYISFDTKARSFTDNEADALDELMERCFGVCNDSGEDIYKLASNELI